MKVWIINFFTYNDNKLTIKVYDNDSQYILTS